MLKLSMNCGLNNSVVRRTLASHASCGMRPGGSNAAAFVTRRETLKLSTAPILLSAASSSRALASSTEQAVRIPEATLNDGNKIPLVGLGTWRINPDKTASSAVETGIKAGYRHIDCAKVYDNEDGVGRGIANGLKATGLSREDLFVVTKLFNDDHEPERVRQSCKEALQRLGLEYLDLYLVHWPLSDKPAPQLIPPYKDTWRAMEELVDAGLVKSIGISNMTKKKTEDLLSYAKIKPAVNQVEIHPYWRNSTTVDYCKGQGIHCTAYSPLGSIQATKESGAPLVSEDPEVIKIADSLGKSPSQILLRWGIERGISVIPKATSEQHIQENIKLLEFDISEDVLKTLDGLKTQERTCKGDAFLDEKGPYRTFDELWDGEGGY